MLYCSKLQSDALREAISSIVQYSKETKKRNFTETIELQIGLKNYDPQKDKRFSGSVKLPHIPRPKMKVCMLGDAQHVEEVIVLLSLNMYRSSVLFWNCTFFKCSYCSGSASFFFCIVFRTLNDFFWGGGWGWGKALH